VNTTTTNPKEPPDMNEGLTTPVSTHREGPDGPSTGTDHNPIRACAGQTDNTLPGGPSAKTFHQAGSANHQVDSKEPHDV
jgi:hypothetical protein